MRPLLVIAGLLLALAVPAGTAAPAAATAAVQPAPTGTLEVTFDRPRVSGALGDRFTVRSRITNSGGAPTDRLIAHLNVASLTSDVYVDPEDWSASRTRELDALAPGGSTSLSWDIQAVNAGSFDVYVVLLPVGASSAGTGPLVVSPPVHAEVAGRRTLTAGGALPVAAAVPILLGLMAATVRFRGRRAG
jgi:hypothetical protein